MSTRKKSIIMIFKMMW